ncbi:UbiE/COQ5 methyltransferase [Coemansia reversa NRRL 1564]|uniref:2-methoxy-6-polyprenyl-1,4-benzoquinol methylase, mitochondrial n=1 Tax=Coemansia reversa (strain ATCC 12441 / NRRL 1564) TaxID=763665 RepID=A0A2G5B304_COERN|nr:UbiE/COQ5 methyltransferase [Coemansia reversa NRRL 1564]|eukprot:PIA13409.1 UbiE/COQ5 methyltransferase [Coemansia reversa NRRL 1564]
MNSSFARRLAGSATSLIRTAKVHIPLRAFSLSVTHQQQQPQLQNDQTQHNHTTTTHFGFKTVPEEVKESLVRNVFSSVASNYDMMNDAMSLGIHRLWKDHFMRNMAPTPGAKLLDVAGGTGDIAHRFLNYQDNINCDSTSTVHMVDINPDMLREGERRFSDSKWKQEGRIDFTVGNAENLDFIKDNSFDAYSIAFGIRNCTHPDRVVREAFRVLKPGGRFMCLEFSRVTNPLLAVAYDLHSFYVIPKLGEIIANDRNSYEYLVESIRKFPTQDDFAQIIREAGFTTIGSGYENLTFGTVAIHSGFKF